MRGDVQKDLSTVHREDPLIGDFPLQDGEATPESISGYGIRMDLGDMPASPHAAIHDAPAGAAVARDLRGSAQHLSKSSPQRVRLSVTGTSLVGSRPASLCSVIINQHLRAIAIPI